MRISTLRIAHAGSLLFQLLALFLLGFPAWAQLAPQALVGFRTNNIVAEESSGSISVLVYRDGNPDGTNRVRVGGTLGSGTQTPISFPSTDLTFMPGASEIELVLVVEDNDVRAVNRPLTLSLSPITQRTTITNRYSALNITIPDDDAMTVRLSTNAYAFRENRTNATIELFRTGNDRIPVSVDLRVADPLGMLPGALRLYALSTQRVDFAISQTQRSVTIPLQPLQRITGPSTARILLENLSTPLAVYASPSTATLTVLDIDGALSLGTNVWAQPGATSVTVNITRNGTAAGTGFLALEERTALRDQDFIGTRIPFEFPESTNVLSITIPLLDNPARIHGRWFEAVLQGVEPLSVAAPVVRVWIPPATAALGLRPRFQADPTVPTTGLPTNVLALAPGPNNTWYVGGGFNPPPGATVSNLVRLTRTFAVDPSWSPSGPPNGTVRHAASFPDGRLLVGGDFTQWSGEARSRLALLETSGALADTGNSLDVTNVTRIIPDVRGRVYVSGSFTQLAGIEFPGLARFSSTADLEAFFRPNTNDFGAFARFAPLAPEGLVLIRPDYSAVFLDDSGASNATIGSHFFTPGVPALTPLPDGSVRLSQPTVRLTVGGSTDSEVAREIPSNATTWSSPSGFFYMAVPDELGWKLTRHWGDGTPDPRLEVWFNAAPSQLVEASDGAVLITGAFRLVDGMPSGGFAQLLPPPPTPGIRWHAGSTGFTIGERARHFRAPAFRETDLDSAREIPIPLPASPALATDAPATALLRFDAGSRVGWMNVPLRNQSDPGLDSTFELRLPEAELSPGASPAVALKVYRDEQTFGFSHSTLVLPEPIGPGFSSTDSRSRPHLAVRRLSGFAYPGNTVARFKGGTVRAHISTFPANPLNPAFDFYAQTGDIPFDFLPGESSFALRVAPYDNALADGDRTADFALDGPGPGTGLHATIVVRDNDSRGPAGVVGQNEFHQARPGVPFLFRAQGSVDGRLHTYQMAAADGWIIGDNVTPNLRQFMLYLGPGPGGTHYISQYDPFSSSGPHRLSRHFVNGTLDSTFATVSFGFGFAGGGSVPMAYAHDGSLLILTRDGGVNLPNGPFMVTRIVRRYSNAGALDTNYAGQVYVPRLQGGVFQPMEAIFLPQSDGGVLVLAYGALATNQVGKDIVRLLPSGITDPNYRAQITFNANYSPSLPRITYATLDAQGRCLLQGAFNRVDGVPRPGLARLTPSGRIDPSFDPRFFGSYPDTSVTSLQSMPNGRTLIALMSTIRSTLLILDETGNPDPAIPAAHFNGPVGGAVVLPGGIIVANGLFQEVQGQERFNEAWLDSNLNLLGRDPLALRLNRTHPTTTEVTLDARAAGTIRIEQGSLNGTWESVREVNVLPGATSVTVPTPAGDHWFLRALRRE